MLSRFLIPERYGRTDRQTDKFAISISHVSMLTRDKKSLTGNHIQTFLDSEFDDTERSERAMYA